MKLHTLSATAGARPAKHRVGRGHAAGKGKQAGKGQSGQNKRGGVRPGFEGGQNPWFRRLPKRGFTNVNHIEYEIVSLAALEAKFSANAVVDLEQLAVQRLVRRSGRPVKILATGRLTKKLTVRVHAASQAAIAAIEAAGGTIEVI